MQKYHFGSEVKHDALCAAVNNAWHNSRHFETVLPSVFNRLHKVLVLVVEGEGSNDLVESKRGKKYKMLDTWCLPGGEEERKESIQLKMETDATDVVAPVASDFEIDVDNEMNISL